MAQQCPEPDKSTAREERNATPDTRYHVSPVNLNVSDLTASITPAPSLWRNPLSRFVAKTDPENGIPKVKTVLSQITASMPSGSITAIIGGSGSGKTTLLNVLSRRMTTVRMHVDGSIEFNGKSKEPISKVRSAYLMQQDVLIPSLTVRETLQYAAELRLKKPETRQEREQIVERVILELGLKECANTRIGTSAQKGCSGGEKRRTSIGVQMLANPSILFCDEPTTGLDAMSALQVIRTLKHLAESGRTVIISIHAPRSEIWQLFDRIILLSQGSVLYAGSTADALDHFASCGHVMPQFVNPAEFLVDLAAFDSRSAQAEQVANARIGALKAQWARKARETEEKISQSPASREDGNANELSASVSFTRKFMIFTRRNFVTAIRDPLGVVGSVLTSTMMALVCGWIFFDVGEDLAGIRSRQGSLYTVCSLNGYMFLLFETHRLSVDIQVFDRERLEGVAEVSSYLLSRRAARFFLEDLPVPTIFTCIYYYMNGFDGGSKGVSTFLGLSIINYYLAMSCATLCISVSRNFGKASFMGNICFTFQSMCCGFFVQADQIPVYARWMKWLVYNFYVFSAVCVNEFMGHTSLEYGRFYACPYSTDPSNPACREYTGKFIVDSLGIPSSWQRSVYKPILVACAFVAAMFFMGAFLLHLRKVNIDVVQSRSSAEESHAASEIVLAHQHESCHKMNISLEDYKLTVKKFELTLKGPSTKNIPIIQPLHAEFQSGKLNVIMGPSGSGKTSLLSSLAGRLRNSYGTRYEMDGRILYNGSIPSPSVMKSVTSFVAQDDDALMSSLTVRETLRFAAGLRLPPWMSKDEKNRRAEDILLKMGLKPCANNLIGSDFVKGISGGEKRRVGIAVQILTDPKVLLLDEPTSGLDAFTAAAIIEVLRNLALEGRTLILTIHQSRSDLFNYFDNILLLARGGNIVYSGDGSSMLDHFRRLGYQCPPNTNPADFALDLITIDLQEEQREMTSRQKVERLIDSWQVRSADGKNDVRTIEAPAELGKYRRLSSPLRIVFPLVLKRSTLNFSRQPDLIFARLFQTTGFVIVLVWFFAPLKSNYEAVQTRMGFIQQMTSYFFVGMTKNVAVYPLERDVFYREEDDGAYSVEAFLLQYTTLEVAFDIVTSIIGGLFYSFVIGVNKDIRTVFILAYNCFCLINCGESLGIMACTLFTNVGFAVNILSLVLSIATTMGGVVSLNVPPVLSAINYISPLKYSVANIAPYSMESLSFSCEDAQLSPDGNCPISTGVQVLQMYKLDKNPGLYVLGTGICTMAYRTLAYILLKVTRSTAFAERIDDYSRGVRRKFKSTSRKNAA
ncbi:hypothetical protein KEM54_001269 [Ascosphaera aggregata]|nr:hypothetical protein KEM54_001269 [Ascosphaera aggregata]